MPKRVYELMFNPGEVVEIRAIGGLKGRNKAWEGACFGAKGTVSGYFDNAEAFGASAKALDDAGAHGVYYTLNPCRPALIARAYNRLKANIHTTTDGEIELIRWLPIDLDPRRPTGISSSQAELDAAVSTAKLVAEHLEGDLKWARGLRAFSGNGYHLMYRLPDYRNSEEYIQKIRDILAYLSGKFTSDRVIIDEVVHNPARIWKCYGTHARKGDSIPERPHRVSRILSKEQKLADVEVTE